MRFFPAVASLFVMLGCGIMSLIFGLPERYIERDVKVDEMTGIWSVTPESELDVNLWATKHSDWGISAPWKTFTLNSDGSCKLELESSWLGESSSNETIASSMISCTWNLAEEENLSDKISPVLKLDFEYPNNHFQMYSLYIFEENGELIIWDFIGDPDDFRPQDFVKVKE